MTTPNDWPRELVEMTAAAICNEDAKTTTWDKIRPATADRYRELAVAALSVAGPEIARMVRMQLAREIEADADAVEENSAPHPATAAHVSTLRAAARSARGETP